MPITIRETAITLDHDLGECRVDTSVRGIGSKLVKLGFIEVTKENSAPYRRFVGQVDQVAFRKVKGKRRAAPEGAKFGRKTRGTVGENE